MSLHGSNVPYNTWSLPRGYDYDWSKPTFPRNPDLWKTAKTFLTEALEKSGTDVAEVYVPVRKVDEEVAHYNMQDATASQSAVLHKVFGKIREWMEWEADDQKSKFVPLILTVRGAAGTGESLIINTIVSKMRHMFDDNDVFHVVAPTGMAAFNVPGGTLHRFAGLDWRNMKKGMTSITMDKLQKKLQNTVAIMMYERSMMSQIILGFG
jgi:hypothetical protein